MDKRRIKRGVDFNKEMAKGKYGWSEAASDRHGSPISKEMKLLQLLQRRNSWHTLNIM